MTYNYTNYITNNVIRSVIDELVTNPQKTIQVVEDEQGRTWSLTDSRSFGREDSGKTSLLERIRNAVVLFFKYWSPVFRTNFNYAFQAINLASQNKIVIDSEDSDDGDSEIDSNEPVNTEINVSSQSDYISNMPLDILRKIFERTSLQDMANARRTSKKFRRAAAIVQMQTISSEKLKVRDLFPKHIPQQASEIIDRLLSGGAEACRYLTHADFGRVLFGVNQMSLERLVEECPNIRNLKINGATPWEPLTVDLSKLHSLQELHLMDFEIKSSLKLPQSLQVLSLIHCPIDEELELPNSLRELYLGGGAATCVPKVLPKSLVILDLSDTDITYLPELPDSLELLDCRNCNKLIIIPTKLPNSLRKINFSCTKITVLPELPESLEVLNCAICSKLTAIPKLPSSLKKYSFILCDNLENPPDPLYKEPPVTK